MHNNAGQGRENPPPRDHLKIQNVAGKVVDRYRRDVSTNGSRPKAVEAVVALLDAHPRFGEPDLNGFVDNLIASSGFNDSREFRWGAARFFTDEWGAFVEAGKNDKPASMSCEDRLKAAAESNRSQLEALRG